MDQLTHFWSSIVSETRIDVELAHQSLRLLLKLLLRDVFHSLAKTVVCSIRKVNKLASHQGLAVDDLPLCTGNRIFYRDKQGAECCWEDQLNQYRQLQLHTKLHPVSSRNTRGLDLILQEEINSIASIMPTWGIYADFGWTHHYCWTPQPQAETRLTNL